uniref:Uncharacterized protein n=1 Tax=Setaria italica TaxID=4555 RepID=K3ZYY6_SETIT
MSHHQSLRLLFHIHFSTSAHNFHSLQEMDKACRSVGYEPWHLRKRQGCRDNRTDGS